MTIDDAIEILGGYIYEEKPCEVGRFDEATKLGIEALKRIREHRAEFGNIPTIKLQGETR